MKEGDRVRILALWSQMEGRIGMVMEVERDEVIVNFGDPLMYHRLGEAEVETVETRGGEIPWPQITIWEARRFYQGGKGAVCDGDKKAVVLLAA